MHIIRTILDVIGALVAAFGGIMGMQELWRMTWRRTTARIVKWTRESDRSRARLSYEANGKPLEVDCAEQGFASDVKAHPEGTSVPIRYRPSNPEFAEFLPDLQSRLMPVWFLLAAVVAFALGSLIH